MARASESCDTNPMKQSPRNLGYVSPIISAQLLANDGDFLLRLGENSATFIDAKISGRVYTAGVQQDGLNFM